MPVEILFLLIVCCVFALAAAPVTLVPKPKSAAFADESPIELEEGRVAIVLGENASEPELAAAGLLAKTVQRRFRQRWPVLRETDPLPQGGVIVLAGQRSTSSLLDRLCSDWRVDLSGTQPGFDGYVIRCGRDSGRDVVLLGATNGRAVFYAQDTLFQLLSREGERVVLTRATIDDWPSVPWRGRPQSRNSLHLRPGTWDAYMRARMNYIDLRDSPERRRGQYGYLPGYPVDVEETSAVIAAAHARDIFIYANVLCAVAPEKYDAVIEVYEELVGLGADGLWISIDDPGAPHRWGMTHDLMARVMDLAGKLGMSGTDIAVIPGRYNSKHAGTPQNLKAMEIPGMRESLYFTTLTPTVEVLQDFQSTLGLKTRLAWWHNWPRPEGGLTHSAYGGVTLRKEKPAYLELPQLSLGWNDPSYDDLRRAGECLDAVQPFGGGGWGAEYTADVIGWWAWDPAGHEWEAVRRRIYDVVYGPSQVEAAVAFDSAMPKLRAFFTLPGTNPRPEAAWPPRLKDLSTRDQLKAHVAEMESVLRKLRGGAPGESLLEPDVLEDWYLEPMEATLRAARTMASLPYPEYWWDAHCSRQMIAVASGNLEQARVWNQEARERVRSEVEQVTGALADFEGMESYSRRWLGRFDLPQAPFIERPPALTGDLSDPAWQEAIVIEPLTSVAYGGVPKDRTEVRLMHSADAIYIGFTCFESDMDKLLAAHTERDSDIWRDDSVEVFVCPSALGTPYFQFVTNSIGAMSDARRESGQAIDPGWNGDWQVRSALGSDRWTAEFRIPLSGVGVNDASGAVWLANFVRNDHAGTVRDFIPDVPAHLSAWGPSRDLHDASKFRAICFASR